VLACPKRGWPLYEAQEAGGLRFRCASGHGYEPDALCPGIADDLAVLLPELLGALTD
jgi:hypothetical protein